MYSFCGVHKYDLMSYDEYLFLLNYCKSWNSLKVFPWFSQTRMLGFCVFAVGSWLGTCQNMLRCFSLSPISLQSGILSVRPAGGDTILTQLCTTSPKIYLQPDQLRQFHGMSGRWCAVWACRGMGQWKTMRSLPMTLDRRHVWEITSGKWKTQRQVKHFSLWEHAGPVCGHWPHLESHEYDGDCVYWHSVCNSDAKHFMDDDSKLWSSHNTGCKVIPD